MFVKLIQRVVNSILDREIPVRVSRQINQVVKLEKGHTYLLVVPDDVTALEIVAALHDQVQANPALARQLLVVSASKVSIVDIHHT